MADPSADPDTDPTSVGPDRGSTPGMPRWAKVFLIAALVFALLLIVLLLTGGGHGPGSHMSAGSIGEPADPAQALRTVDIATLDTMSYDPSNISVSAGETVTFAVTNTGKAVHEFTLGDATMQQEHAESMAHMPAGMTHDTSSSISLQPGETKELTWRFGDAATLEYACHQPDHYEAGMHGEITIA